jgi:tetratricopeptide (TPR) repeat protein
MAAARDTFHRIYQYNKTLDVIDNILEKLDFHPLSVVLLATVAHQSKWDENRLVMEWERRKTSVLRTQHDKSLATTIELSLTSPMFEELGPGARELLGVVAFFPQGVDENNLDWLFPTISDRHAIFDKFFILSLTYRSQGFITMLAPLRAHLAPKNPDSSPLLQTTKNGYFNRLAAEINPNGPALEESRWITSEDINVEHLLDIFTSIDTNSNDTWNACANFITHLSWHKRRHTVLSQKIEGLPDDHRFKSECTFELAQLFYLVGKYADQKRLLTHMLELQRRRGSEYGVAQTLGYLSTANRPLHLYKEGIQQVEEALKIFERLGNRVRQASCLDNLALLLHTDNQLNDAEKAASDALRLLPKKGEEFLVCQSHRVLGDIYLSKGENQEAIAHFKAAGDIALSFNWNDQLFWVHYSLASLFFKEDRLDDTHTHITKAKLY